MASLSQALRLGDLPPPHRTYQGHATHLIEWSMMLRPNDSWSTCIPQGIATFLHYASRRSAGYRYATRSSETMAPGYTTLIFGARSYETRYSDDQAHPAAACVKADSASSGAPEGRACESAPETGGACLLRMKGRIIFMKCVTRPRRKNNKLRRNARTATHAWRPWRCCSSGFGSCPPCPQPSRWGTRRPCV